MLKSATARLPVRVGARVPARWALVLGLFVGLKIVLTLVGLVPPRAYDGVSAAPLAGWQ